MCESCERLLREKKSVIERAAFMCCRDSSLLATEVDDIKAEAYLKVVVAKTQVGDLASKPNSYFHSLVRNLSIDLVRSRNRQGETVDFDDISESHQSLIADCVSVSAENRQLILRLFELIPPELRQILWSIHEGLSINECAALWEVSEANAKQKRYRAIQAARELLPQLVVNRGGQQNG